jgi:hypothetical protein
MKKLQFLLLVFAMGVMVSCNQNKKNDQPTSDDEVTVNDEIVNDDEPVADIDESTQRFQLLGTWQDVNDPTYKMEITPKKFKNYVEGSPNWDQDYVLATTADIENVVADDNGSYLMVYDDDGKIFYACEVKAIMNDHLVVEHFVGGSAGNHLEFERE